jgi:hypothetical protein
LPVIIQPSFSKGEIGPSLYGRVDTAAYQVALRNARNMIIRTAGGASNRAGLEFIGPCKSHGVATPPVLIDFQFKTTDSYVLEFGHLYMRVIRNDAHVVEAGITITGITQANPAVVTAVAHGYADGDEVYIQGVGGMTQVNGKRYIVDVLTANTFALKNQVTSANIDSTAFTAYTSGGESDRIYTLVTPYDIADLDRLNWVQSADVMTLTHKSYAPRELSRLDHDEWTLEVLDVGPSIEFPRFEQITVNSAGAVTYLYRVTALKEDTLEESLPGIARNNSRAITGATNANPVVITATAHGFATGDIVYIENVGGMTQINNRSFTVTNIGANSFSLNGENGITHGVYTSGGVATEAITAITQANPAVVTAEGHGFIDGDEVYLENIGGMTELNGGRYIINQLTADTFELTGIDSTGFAAYTSGGTAHQTFVRTTLAAATPNNTITWTAVEGAEQYVIYKFDSGSYGFIGQTEALTFLDDNIAPDLSISHPREKDPFRFEGDWPGAAGYFEQRRVFGGTENKPDTSYYSQTGNQSNFNISSPLQDDDAITAALQTQQVNEIRHYVSKNDLLMFTSGLEARVNSGPDAAFSATSIKQKPQSTWGCSYIKPIQAGSTVLFVEENNARVRSFGYSFQLDGYTGAGLTLLASHLFDNGKSLVRWAYAANPEPRVHAVRSDGKALCLSFDEEQDVVAWAPWDTKGKFKSVCTLRNPSGTAGDNTGVYFVVQRRINGNTVNYIEKLNDREFDVVQDCFFVDCGNTIDNPIAITGVTTGTTTVITAPAHGFVNDEDVDISDIIWETVWDDDFNETQPDQLNGSRYIVKDVTTDTFRIVDSDGEDIDSTDFEPYIESGFIREPVLTISNLDHIEGEEVSVLSDGNVVEDLVVTNGAITLPRAASRIHVGLRYIADVETLNVESSLGFSGQTVQGKLKKIPQITIRFEKSRGLFYGHSNEDLTEMKQREDEDWGEPTSLLTGDRQLTMPGDWDRNGRVFIRQRYPLPMTILAIVPDLTFEDGMNE